jgi:putative transposon-encoded protein
MKRAVAQEAVTLTVDGVEGFYEKTVTAFGTGAKIDCPRQYLGRNVYVIIRRLKKE